MYSPVLGRFISADTLVPLPENPQSLNRFSYTYNNPIKYTDPTGQFSPEAVAEYCSQHPQTCNLKAWQANENWWNMLMTAVAGDVLALINSQGKLSYWSFQGTGDSVLTGVAWADNLAGKLHMPLSDIPKGVDLTDISFLQKSFPSTRIGGISPDWAAPENAEAGLWRLENGLLTPKYHRDPRVHLESHVITQFEVQWTTGVFSLRGALTGLALQGLINGIVWGGAMNAFQNEVFPNLQEGNQAITISREGSSGMFNGLKVMFRYDRWRGTVAHSECYMAVDGCIQ